MSVTIELTSYGRGLLDKMPRHPVRPNPKDSGLVNKKLMAKRRFPRRPFGISRRSH